MTVFVLDAGELIGLENNSRAAGGNMGTQDKPQSHPRGLHLVSSS